VALGELDSFTISFEALGLKKFTEELVKNEQLLEQYEREVKENEKALQDMKEAGKETTEEFKTAEKQLYNTREEINKLNKTITRTKQSSLFQLSQIAQNFSKLTQTVVKLAVVGTAVRRSLRFYEQAEQLGFLAEKSGIAAEKLQELGNVSSRFGGTTESTAMSIENIRTNKEEYTKAGIRVENDPVQTLENVARKMEQLKSDSAKWELADSLGIDEATTRALIQGVDKYRESLKQSSKYKLYTQEDIQRMRDYRQIQQDIRQNIDSIYAVIYRGLLPAITRAAKIISKLTEWLGSHQSLVKITATTVGILALASAFNVLSKSLIALAGGSAMMMRFPGWATIIASIVMIIQDFVVFMEGGDSLIGRLWAKWGKDLDVIRAGFEIWAEKIKLIWNNLLACFDKNRPRMEEAIDINVIKPVTAEQAKLRRDHELNKMNKELSESLKGKELSITAKKGYNPFQSIDNWFAMQRSIKNGKQFVTTANKNPLNGVSSEAIAAANITNAINNGNNVISKDISKVTNNDRGIKIGNVTIQLQSSDPMKAGQDVKNVITSLDNGQRA